MSFQVFFLETNFIEMLHKTETNRTINGIYV